MELWQQLEKINKLTEELHDLEKNLPMSESANVRFVFDHDEVVLEVGSVLEYNIVTLEFSAAEELRDFLNKAIPK